jgi:hypothetical protein
MRHTGSQEEVHTVQGAGRGQPTGNLGIGGVRGRGARRGSTRVRGPST